MNLLLRWMLLALPIALMTGSVVAWFLLALDAAIALHWRYEWLLFGLPFAGVAIALLYNNYGASASAGHNQLIEACYARDIKALPLRITPLIFLTTIMTHLFGGSAGREGTAVQIGGSLAAWLGCKLHCNHEDAPVLLVMGMAAGFGAVFGTPFTGAVFALEVLGLRNIIFFSTLAPPLRGSGRGKVRSTAGDAWGVINALPPTESASEIRCISNTDAAPPQGGSYIPRIKQKIERYVINIVCCQMLCSAFLASLLADSICTAWGGWHTDYPTIIAPQTDAMLIGAVLLFGIGCGLVAWFFAAACRSIKALCSRYVQPYWAAPLLGGLLVIALALTLHTRDYLMLGVYPPLEGGNAIITAFEAGGAEPEGWLMKTLFTAVTLGSGFKGGEVTPLFYVGSAFGNMVATLADLPIALFAATGFVAVFAGATKTPIACTIMGVELFGISAVPYFALACLLAYLCSGSKGIYTAQRVIRQK